MREVARKQVYTKNEVGTFVFNPFEHTTPGKLNYFTTDIDSGGSVVLYLSVDGGKTWLNQTTATTDTYATLANVVPRAKIVITANTDETIPTASVEFEEEEKLYRCRIYTDTTFEVEGQVEKVIVIQTAGTSVKMKLEASFDGENYWTAGSNTTAKTGYFENTAVTSSLASHLKVSATEGTGAKFATVVYYA